MFSMDEIFFFLQIFSTYGWLNLWIQNLQVGRADYIYISIKRCNLYIWHSKIFVIIIIK